MADEAQKPVTPRFASRDWGVASYKRNEYHLTLTPLHTMADVENARLWGDLLGKMNRGDVLEAFKPDSGEWARFVVCESGPGFIRLGKTESFTPATIDIPEGSLATRWNAGKKGHEVIRVADAGRYRIVETRSHGHTIKLLLKEGDTMPQASTFSTTPSASHTGSGTVSMLRSSR